MDASTQTTEPAVICECGEVLKKLDLVLDNLRVLQEDLAMQSCDLSDIRKRCLSIEKQMENVVSWHHHLMAHCSSALHCVRGLRVPVT